MHRTTAFVVITAATALLVIACSAQKKELPSTAPPASSPAIPGVGATAGTAPPAGELPPPPAAAGEFKPQDYQGEVKKAWTEGSIQYDGIVSRFPCRSDHECTSTKFANAPAKEGDCTCAAPCTPYVVTVAEKERREASNKRLCDNTDWYGMRCPAPDCRFIEFEKFKCYEGRCAGLAMGKAQ